MYDEQADYENGVCMKGMIWGVGLSLPIWFAIWYWIFG